MENKMKLQKFIALFSAMMLLVTSLGLQVFAGAEEAVAYDTIGVERITDMKEWKVENAQAAKSMEGDLDGVLLEGVYNFAGNGSINIGGGLWTGLMMGFDRDGLVFQYFNGASNTDFRGKVNISTAETGYTELFGTDMHIKMGFAFSEKTETTANVVITITVGNATKELVLDAVDVSKFGRSLSVYAGGTIVTVKEAPKTYTTLSVRDITGSAIYKVTAGEATKIAEGTLEGALLDGIYNFGGNASFNLGGGRWSGIQVGFNGEGMTVQYIGKDLATFTPVETGYTTMYGEGAQDMRIKMGFTFENKTETTADVTIEVTVGKHTEFIFADDVPLNMFNRAFYVNSYGVPVTIKAASTPELLEGLTVITPADFGIADGTHSFNLDHPTLNRRSYNLHTASGKNMSLNGKVLDMDIQFTTWGSAIYIGNAGWTGFHFYTSPWQNQNFYVENNATGGITGDNTLIWNHQTELETIFDKFNLKFSFEFVTNDAEGTNNDVKIGVWINNVLHQYYYDNNNAEFYNNANIAFYNGVTVSSPKRDVAVPTDNTPYILADFGVGDVANGVVVKAPFAMSESGSSISGKVAFSAGSSMTLYGKNEPNGEWLGLRLLMNNNQLEILHTGVSAGGTVIISDVVAGQTFDFTVAEKVADWNADGDADDVRMQVWINNKLVADFYLLGYKDAMSTTFLLTGASVTNYTDVTYVNAVDGYTVQGEGALTINNAETVAGTVINTSGEYIVRCANAGAYVEYVAVYRTGDARVDNVVDVLDLVAIRNASKGASQITSKAGNKAADVDGNGTIEAADCAGVRDILAVAQ